MLKCHHITAGKVFAGLIQEKFYFWWHVDLNSVEYCVNSKSCHYCEGCPSILSWAAEVQLRRSLALEVPSIERLALEFGLVLCLQNNNVSTLQLSRRRACTYKGTTSDQIETTSRPTNHRSNRDNALVDSFHHLVCTAHVRIVFVMREYLVQFWSYPLKLCTLSVNHLRLILPGMLPWSRYELHAGMASSGFIFRY